MEHAETYAKIDLYKIKLPEQVQNYDELVKFVKKVVQTVDSRDLKKDEMELVEAKKSENDMSKIYDAILSLVESNLIPNASSAESKVVYWKMIGDYHKHLAASKEKDNRIAVVGNASLAYQKAQGIASTNLHAAHSLRLALTLSISEFYLDIHETPERAINLAEEALEAALPEQDDALEKDSETMFELLAEKIMSWKSELAKKEGDQTEDHSSYEE